MTSTGVVPAETLADDTVLALVRALESAGAITPTQLLLTDPDLPYDQFEALGTFLGRVQDGSRWWIGDWLVFGEHVYGEKYAQAADQLGLTPGTLQNYRYVASAVPPERRRARLHFSTHREVAALDAELQDEWLTKAEEEGLTRAQLAAAIRPPKAPPANPGVSREQEIHEVLVAIARDATPAEDGQHHLIPNETFARVTTLLADE